MDFYTIQSLVRQNHEIAVAHNYMTDKKLQSLWNSAI